MNSWNNSQAPAFNLKIYNVITKDLQGKAYELLDSEEYHARIGGLISDFELEHDFAWQAAFNGRSSGYLVIYKGGRKQDGSTFTWPSKNIETNDVPKDILKSFTELAENIIALTEDLATNAEIVSEDYTVTKTRKALHY
jgi:hypothetical protein